MNGLHSQYLLNHTVGEDIIGALKMQNDYGCYQIVLLDFSMMLPVKLSQYLKD